MVLIDAKVDLPDSVCADILSIALEGGIGYWALAREIERTAGEDDDWCYVSCMVRDFEDPDASWMTLDYGVIRCGVERVLTGRVKIADYIRSGILADIVDWEGRGGCALDADAADCIVQAGLFGELVYG